MKNKSNVRSARILPPSLRKAARTAPATGTVSSTVFDMDQEFGALLAQLREVMVEFKKTSAVAVLPTVLTYKEAARQLSVSPSTLKTMVASGLISNCPRGPSGVGIPKDEILRIASTRKEMPKGRRRRSLFGPKAKHFDVEKELAKVRKR